MLWWKNYHRNLWFEEREKDNSQKRSYQFLVNILYLDYMQVFHELAEAVKKFNHAKEEKQGEMPYK